MGDLNFGCRFTAEVVGDHVILRKNGSQISLNRLIGKWSITDAKPPST